MSNKFDLTVTYHFGHSTCNSGPFLFKIGSKYAYLQGVSGCGLNRFGPVFFDWFEPVFLSRKGQTATESPVFSGLSPV